MHKDTPSPTYFLPDFCRGESAFAAIIIAELGAIIFSLADQGGENFFVDLALNSMFCQWVAVGNIVLFCYLRKQLEGLPNFQIGLRSFLISMAVLLIASESSFFLLHHSFSASPQQQLNSHLDFLVRTMGIGSILSALALRYFYVKNQWQQKIQLESRARIEALQARIRPHFLFNCLNTIMSLIPESPKEAEQSIDDLAGLFRISLLSSDEITTTLDQELEICLGYLRIEQYRLGKRLRVHWEIETLPRDARIPYLTLQPLLENAIYYGIELLPRGGKINVAGSLKSASGQSWMIIVLTNPIRLDPTRPRPSGHCMAQENIRLRLSALFGKESDMQIISTEKEYRVVLRIPHRA